MNFRNPLSPIATPVVTFATIASVALSYPLTGNAQNKNNPAADHAKHAQHPADPATSKPLSEQIADLREKVAKLEAVLAKTAAKPPAGMTAPGMGGMMDMMMGGMSGGKKSAGGMAGMGMMDEMMGGMGAGQPMSGMGTMGDDMDMMGMGSMSSGKGMSKMKMAAALPGFPGASHMYHIGATGFFLDHPEHITLSTEQQSRLNRLKQKALTDKSSAQRKIDEAEQELWELTGSDEPDAARIENKVRVVEKLRGDQRLAFIRSVGEAAKVLTDEQRQVLLGTVAGKAGSHSGH